MESMSFQTFYGMRINATHRVRAWGRGYANHTLVTESISPVEGHNKSINLTGESGVATVSPGNLPKRKLPRKVEATSGRLSQLH